MFITYTGTDAALILDVQGKVIRLVPSQPVEITKEQLDILRESKTNQVFIDAGLIEIDNKVKTKAAAKVNSSTKSKN